MSGKDKDNNTMNKLKQLFRKGRTTGAIPEHTDFSLNEIESQIQPETPVAQRCKALREISETVRKTPLEDTEIKKLWDLTKDLIVPNKPAEQRQTALTFYRNLIHGQYESLSIMRAHFFRVIQDHDVPEDIAHRLELLKTLTDNGKNITYFEESIGEFMLRWIPAIVQAGITESYLEIVVNIIKFNAAHLDKMIVVGIVQHACYLSCFIDDTRTVLQCLQVLDATLCYTVFPTETLHQCIIALCRTVNIEMYCQMSWKIMKKLLGTNLGHAALSLMCNILNDSGMYADEALLRGAVFHINMGLWGSSGVPMLRCSPSVVLQSFLHALGSRRIIVTFEVILSIQWLIKTSGKNLSEPTWDVICDILFTIAENIAYYEKTNSLPKDRMVQTSFHETLNLIETYLQRNEIAANPENMYALIEIVSADRPEQSIFQLMKYLTLKISATQPNWLQALSNFVERFFTMSNVNVRMKSIQVLNEIMKDNRASYEEEILDRVVMHHFQNIHMEQDMTVQTAVAKLLLDFACHCETKRCLDLLDIIEKILYRSFELMDCNKSYWQSVVNIVDPLIAVYLVKLYRYPSSHAVRIFNMVLIYLEKLYTTPVLLECSTFVRQCIYSWILSFRANSTFHIGHADTQNTVGNGCNIRFGYYICTDQLQAVMPQEQQQQQVFTFISMRKPFKKILDCLQYEKDWIILELVLKELPNMLQNKAIFQGMDMDNLAVTLVRMYRNRNAPEHLISASNRPSLSEYDEIVLTAIAALVPYHQFLVPFTQKEIIESLRSGLFSRTPRVCVYALTILLLEVPDIMLRNVPDVLLEMSKMSTTVNVAVPVLEFLSTLNRMPNSRFANFVVVQYMYVFAISLPYTNPYKYNHYTVSLAHHVIAGWFLKCRMPLRRNFVNYLIKGFETNVQMPFNETKKTEIVTINEDSTNRKRSSSLTEQGSRRQSRVPLTTQLQTHQIQMQQQQQLQQQSQSKPDDALKNFHLELAETGIDFLARYTFSHCSALPKRLPTADFLLAGGQSMTWLVGHNLITITTSGCNSIPLKTGLCDRCSALCKVPSPKKETPSPANATVPSPETVSTKTGDSMSYNKRYTKASLQHSGGQDSGSSDVTSTSTSSSSAAQTPFPSANQQMEGRFFRQTSNDARFTSSSTSLEAITRRGSNPDTPGSVAAGSGSSVNLQNETKHESISNISRTVHTTSHPTPQQIVERERSKQTCACSCIGWAEICVRRPTGNMSWIFRNQNQVSLDTMSNEFPLNDLISLFVPSLGGVMAEEIICETVNKPLTKFWFRNIPASSHASQDDEEKRTSEIEEPVSGLKQLVSSGPIDIPKPTQPLKESAGSFSDVEPEGEEENLDIEYEDDESRSRNPVRRVNSSPEMSSNWRNPLLNQKGGLGTNQNVGGSTVLMPGQDDDKPLTPEIEQQQKKKGFCKDMRVSCEAIPEEIPGSTPPSNPNSVKDGDGLESKLTAVVNPVKQVEVTSAKPTSLVPSASFSTETKSESENSSLQSQAVPKKQLSADDAIPPQSVPPPDQPAPAPLQLQLAPASKLKIPIEMPKVTTKPPQSPAPLSPRLLAKNAANKVSSFAPSVTGGNNGNGGNSNTGGGNSSGESSNGNENNDMKRGRSKTISVVREHESRDSNRDSLKWSSFKGTRTGLSPSSIFLQLYNAGANKSLEQPIQIGPTNAKAVALLDLIPPYETHKIGVLYVSKSQCNNETEILKNRYGSMRYTLFLRKLGTLVALKDAKENNLFVNMETNGRDGKYTYIWQDEIIQVTFHVATMMPNKDQDPYCHEKKKHIGNDYVSIVYNESGEEYNLNTIKGQFNYACVVVEPMELNSNRIYVRAKDEVVAKYVGHSEPEIVSDASAPLFARQLALHANLASLVAQSLRTKNQSPYASNWLERLRKIKHLRAKILKEHAPTNQSDVSSNGSNSSLSSSNSSLLKLDFTTYTQ